MTKPFLEQKFEQQVMRFIRKLELPAGKRELLLLDFHNNSSEYYINLCDALYAVSTGQNLKPVWLTQEGNCYLSLYAQASDDRLLIYPDEVPPFQLDLINQLEVAIAKI